MSEIITSFTATTAGYFSDSNIPEDGGYAIPIEIQSFNDVEGDYKLSDTTAVRFKYKDEAFLFTVGELRRILENVDKHNKTVDSIED